MRGVRSVGCALALSVATPATAQVLLSGTRSVDGQSYARIYVIFSDTTKRYAPLAGVPILLVQPGGDSVVARTDAAGSVTMFLPPGDYHLVTPLVVWHGREYAWRMVVHVGGDAMRDVVLSAGNALPTVAMTSAITLALSGTRPGLDVAVSAGGVASELGEEQRFVTDTHGLLWTVIEQDFSRAALYGQVLPLPAGLHKLVFLRDGEVRQLASFPSNWRTLSDAQLAALAERAERLWP